MVLRLKFKTRFASAAAAVTLALLVGAPDGALGAEGAVAPHNTSLIHRNKFQEEADAIFRELQTRFPDAEDRLVQIKRNLADFDTSEDSELVATLFVLNEAVAQGRLSFESHPNLKPMINAAESRFGAIDRDIALSELANLLTDSDLIALNRIGRVPWTFEPELRTEEHYEYKASGYWYEDGSDGKTDHRYVTNLIAIHRGALRLLPTNTKYVRRKGNSEALWEEHGKDDIDGMSLVTTLEKAPTAASKPENPGLFSRVRRWFTSGPPSPHSPPSVAQRLRETLDPTISAKTIRESTKNLRERFPPLQRRAN